MEIGQEIISAAILSLPLNHVKVIVNYWRKYVLLILVNCLGGLSMPMNSERMFTDRAQHYLNSVDLAVKRQSTKIHTY